MKKIDWILIGLLAIVTIATHSYKITSPLVEFHSWRQADTAVIARNFVREGFDLLHPKYDDISPLQTGFDNTQRYRMVEFPFYNALIGLGYAIIPQLAPHIWGRIFSTLASIAIVASIYYIARRESGIVAALFASLAFAILPFFVFYTRAVLPEPTATALYMIALVLLLLRRDRPSKDSKNIKKWLILGTSTACMALAILVKPTAIFFLIPFVYLAFSRLQGISKKNILIIGGLVAATLIPFALWRWHIGHFPEGIPSSQWLFTSVNTGSETVMIFFRPAFFRWMLYERLGLLITGVYLLPLVVLGVFARMRTYLPFALAAGSIVYVLTFQGGNVQHEYYQVLILPAVALFIGLGAETLFSLRTGKLHRIFAVICITTLLALGWIFAWEKVHHYYYSLSDIPKFASIVQTLTTRNDRIVTDTQGDTTVLYNFDRIGAPAVYTYTSVLREKGYTHIFTYTRETADNLMKGDDKITVVFQNDRFSLLKLN